MKKRIYYSVSKKSKYFAFIPEDNLKHLVEVPKNVVQFANRRRKYDHLTVFGLQTGWNKPYHRYFHGRKYPIQKPVITKFFMLPDVAFRITAAYYATKYTAEGKPK